jgi:hypothetical protein
VRIKTLKHPISKSLLLAAITSLLITGAHARTWTSADGAKTFEGELKAYDPATGMVGVTLSNGKEMKFSQKVLSPADIAFLEDKGKVEASTAGKPSEGKIDADPKNLFKPADGKPADMSKPVQVFILLGQSNMVGAGKVAGLESAVKQEKKYPYLLDEAGNWAVRQDVRNVRVMFTGMLPWKQFNNEWMTITGGTIGPEFGLGHALGNAIDAPVMILKSCIGNRALGWDLLPPNAEGYAGTGEIPRKPKAITNPKTDWYAGLQYDGDVNAAQDVLADLKTYYPKAKKYEVAGFFFWQGEKDSGNPEWAAAYEKNLVLFIKALRDDFKAPNAKFVLATLGEDTEGCGNPVFDAQMAVDGKKGKYPEFKGNVATVYSNPLSMGGSGNGHYGGNAETYMNVGEAMGQAMVELLANKN